MTTPLFMRDVSLTLKLVTGTAAEFNCDAHTAEIVSNAGDTVEYVTLCPDGSYSSPGRTTYALHIVAAQDWSSTGLARFLWENEGALATFTYQPHGADIDPSDTAPGMSGEVRLIAPNMGGEADTYAELDVEMPCSSKPTLAIAAFPAGFAAEAEAEPEPEPATVAA
jgi:hypothetical protein